MGGSGRENGKEKGGEGVGNGRENECLGSVRIWV